MGAIVICIKSQTFLKYIFHQTHEREEKRGKQKECFKKKKAEEVCIGFRCTVKDEMR